MIYLDIETELIFIKCEFSKYLYFTISSDGITQHIKKQKQWVKIGDL